MIDYKITKRRLKKDLLHCGGVYSVMAHRGDLVDTFCYDPGGDLWVRVKKWDMVVWKWEIEDFFEEIERIKPFFLSSLTARKPLKEKEQSYENLWAKGYMVKKK